MRLINFDWSGTVGTVRFPAGVNREAFGAGAISLVSGGRLIIAEFDWRCLAVIFSLLRKESITAATAFGIEERIHSECTRQSRRRRLVCLVLVSTGSGRELNRGSTRQSSSGLRQSKNRPCTGAVPDLGTAKSAGNNGPEARQDADRAHGFRRVMGPMNQRFSSLKLETGSVRKARESLCCQCRGPGVEGHRAKPPGPAPGLSHRHSTSSARHVWADSDTVSQRQSLAELDADRSTSAH